MPPTQVEAQRNATTAGQRKVNLIWEYTQAAISILVIATTMAVNVYITIILINSGKDMTAGQAMGMTFLNFICGIVISFYYSRTNHAAIGGIGPKPRQEYDGR